MVFSLIFKFEVYFEENRSIIVSLRRPLQASDSQKIMKTPTQMVLKDVNRSFDEVKAARMRNAMKLSSKVRSLAVRPFYF